MKAQLITLLLASAPLQASQLAAEFCTALGNTAERIVEIRDAKGPKQLTVRLMRENAKDNPEFQAMFLKVIDSLYADPTTNKIEANLATYMACMAVYNKE